LGPVHENTNGAFVDIGVASNINCLVPSVQVCAVGVAIVTSGFSLTITENTFDVSVQFPWKTITV